MVHVVNEQQQDLDCEVLQSMAEKDVLSSPEADPRMGKEIGNKICRSWSKSKCNNNESRAAESQPPPISPQDSYSWGAQAQVRVSHLSHLPGPVVPASSLSSSPYLREVCFALPCHSAIDLAWATSE